MRKCHQLPEVRDDPGATTGLRRQGPPGRGAGQHARPLAWPAGRGGADASERPAEARGQLSPRGRAIFFFRTDALSTSAEATAASARGAAPLGARGSMTEGSYMSTPVNEPGEAVSVTDDAHLGDAGNTGSKRESPRQSLEGEAGTRAGDTERGVLRNSTCPHTALAEGGSAASPWGRGDTCASLGSRVPTANETGTCPWTRPCSARASVSPLLATTLVGANPSLGKDTPVSAGVPLGGIPRDPREHKIYRAAQGAGQMSCVSGLWMAARSAEHRESTSTGPMT